MSACDEDTTGSHSENEDDESQDDKTLENRRAHLQKILSLIEEHFTKSKHQLYLERKNLYDIKIKQLNENPNSNVDLASGIAELMAEVQARKEVAAKLKELQSKSVSNWFHAEQQQIKQTLENRKIEEQSKMKLKFLNKIDEIQDSLRNSNIPSKHSFHFPYVNCGRYIKGGNRLLKAKNSPYVIYQLKQDLINEDWNFIRKSTRDMTLAGPVITVDNEFDFL